MFTKIFNNTYSYVSAKEFDSSIKTDTEEKRRCRTNPTLAHKHALPAYYFLYNVEGTLFTYMCKINATLLPNEVIDYKDIQFTGIVCLDIDHVSPKEVSLIKENCCLHNEIKYCATSCSGKGCFILYDVGKVNQTSYTYVYKNVFPIVTNNILKPIRKSISIDPISLSILVTRIESYDPEPYNNLNLEG